MRKQKLTLSMIQKAIKKMRKHGYAGDLFLEIHPSMREVALEAHREGIITLMPPPKGSKKSILNGMCCYV